MNTFEWALGTLLSLLGAYVLTRFFRFDDPWDKIVTYTLFWMFLICLDVFVAGAVFHNLTNLTTLCINIVVVALSFVVFRVRFGYTPSVKRLGIESLGKAIRSVSSPYAVILIILILIVACVGYLLPPYAYDELGYHLVSVATWVHNKRIMDSGFLWADVYPRNAELLFCWLYMADHTDRFVHFGQIIFAVAGICGMVGVSGLMGLSKRDGIIAAILFFLTPTVLLQVGTDYTDVAFVSMFFVFYFFYLRYLWTTDERYIFLAGMSGGILFGIKSDAVIYIAVCGVVILVQNVYHYFRGTMRIKRFCADTCLFLVPMVVLGGYWYLHNLTRFGNPVYPFSISLLGHVIFRGLGTVTKLIMIPNTPTEFLDLPWWRRVWVSWTTIPNVYGYDMRIGGFGVQWTFLELPAVILFIIYSWTRKRVYLWSILLPLAVIFVFQPANWWARYSLFLAGLGGWAYVYMVNLLRSKRLRTTIHVVVIGSICVGYGLGAYSLLNSNSQIRGAIHRLLVTPAKNRGSVLVPEYRLMDRVKQPTMLLIGPNVEFPYVFFGRSAENSVMRITAKTNSAFQREILTEHAKYVVATEGDVVDGWAKQDSRLLQPDGGEGRYVIYRVQLKTIVGSTAVYSTAP